MPTSGAALERIVLKAARVALKGEGQDIHDEAKRQIGNVSPSEDPTPGLSLAESGRVSSRTNYGRADITVEVEFGKGGGGWHGLGTAGYAKVQHERRDLAHPRGGKSKWLEDPLKQSVPTLAANVAARIRAVL